MYSKFINRQFVRYAFVGLLATIVHYIVYLLLGFILSANIAFTLGYITSLCANFYLSAHFTFKTSMSVKRGFGFLGSHIINYTLQIIILNICILYGVPEKFAPIPVYAICIPLNFFMVKFVFRKF